LRFKGKNEFFLYHQKHQQGSHSDGRDEIQQKAIFWNGSEEIPVKEDIVLKPNSDEESSITDPD